jgi:hypothetical protein
MTGRSILSNKIDNMYMINQQPQKSSRIKSAATIRPSSVNTFSRRNQHGGQNLNQNLKSKLQTQAQRPKSSAKTRTSYLNPNMSININFNNKSDMTIEDPEIIENLKGTLIRTIYTNREGKYTLDSLPHDTYLIEIENSKNFIGCAQVFKMNFIIETKGDPKKINDPLNYFGNTSRLIGLKRQTDAYVSVYISFINNLENYDFMPIRECVISLRKIIESTATDLILEQGKFIINLFYIYFNLFYFSFIFPLYFPLYFFLENKIIIPDNKKIDGRYDIIIVPGKYIIEVYKPGYDIIRKEIELISGENNLNMDLSLEKKYYLNINCINYETGLPLEKAVINVKKFKYKILSKKFNKIFFIL